jgi:hypothetical protein
MELAKEIGWDEVEEIKESDVVGEGPFLKPCIYKRR